MPGTELDPSTDAVAARGLLAWGLQAFDPKLALACSFQPEDIVLLDLLLELQRGARVFALDTGGQLREAGGVWTAAEQRYDTVIEPWRGHWVDGLWREDDGGIAPLHAVEPVDQAPPAPDAWITGVRRDQSPARAGARKLEWDRRQGLWRLNPLVDWTEEEVWLRIHERSLPHAPLRDGGVAAIGCVHCAGGEDNQDQRWPAYEPAGHALRA